MVLYYGLWLEADMALGCKLNDLDLGLVTLACKLDKFALWWSLVNSCKTFDLEVG